MKNATIRRLIGAAHFVFLFSGPVAYAQTTASPFTTGYRYDNQGRTTGIISPDPDGIGPLHFAATRNSYDGRGNLIRVEKGELTIWQSEDIAPAAWSGFTPLQKMEMAYDSLSRKIVESKIVGNTVYDVTQYSYDNFGRLECTAIRMNAATFGSLPASACALGVTGAQGADRITKIVFDAAGQTVKVQKAYATALQQDYATYTYSPNGKPITMIDANGNKATMTWDAFDRQSQWNFPSKTASGVESASDYESYTYDANDNRLTFRKRDGQVIVYTYDSLNRMTVKDIPGGTAGDVYYAYDWRGLQLSARFGSVSGAGIVNTFDGFGEQTSATNTMEATPRALTYQYDANGNRLRITHPDGVYFTYDYDGLDRPVTIKENGTTSIATTTYDIQGRRSGDTRGAVSTSYAYDPVSRLLSLSNDLAGTTRDLSTAFTYNPANQIVTKTRSNDAYSFTGYVDVSRMYATNGLNQYSAAGPANFTYDANGNLTGDGNVTYVYDVENRLISNTGGNASSTFEYDPMGRLWRQTVPGKSIVFVYDGDAMVFEYNGNSTGRYVHGNDDDDPMVMYFGAGLNRWSLQTDAQGSIVSTADMSGVPLYTNTYDEYGIPGAGNFGRFQYTGQLYLAQLGMYYYKARIYSPTLGRFLQTDPVGYKDQNNLYAYVGNDPTNGKDPAGLATVWNYPGIKLIVVPVVNGTNLPDKAILDAYNISGVDSSGIVIVVKAEIAQRWDSVRYDVDPKLTDEDPGKMSHTDGRGGRNVYVSPIADARTIRHEAPHTLGANDQYRGGVGADGNKIKDGPTANTTKSIMNNLNGTSINQQTIDEISKRATDAPSNKQRYCYPRADGVACN